MMYYEDFQKYMKEQQDTSVVEMDCVEGEKGGKGGKVLLTLIFRNCNLMLILLLENQDQECVLEIFIWLETVLGQDVFKKLFPVILTNYGEFAIVRMVVLSSQPGKKWKNSVMEPKAPRFFIVIRTVSGKKVLFFVKSPCLWM